MAQHATSTIYRVTFQRPGGKARSRTFGRLTAAHKFARSVQLPNVVTDADVRKRPFLKAGTRPAAQWVRIDQGSIIWTTVVGSSPLDVPKPTEQQQTTRRRKIAAAAKRQQAMAPPKPTVSDDARKRVARAKVGKRWTFDEFEALCGPGFTNLLNEFELVQRVVREDGNGYEVERI